MKRIIQWSVLSLSIVCIFGCSHFQKNILLPELLPKENTIAEELEKKYLSYDGPESKIKKYVTEFENAINGTETAKYIDDSNVQKKLKYRRNDIIGNLVLLMNIRYSQYERAFYNTGAVVGSAFDITTLAVTATGAVTGGATTKSILSAIAAGLTGSRLALEKNFLYEKSSPVLIAKMRKLREDKLKVITANMNKEIVAPTKKGEDGKGEVIEGYSLEQGLMDVQDYFYKGTVIGALQAMSEEIGKPTPLDMEEYANIIKKLNNSFGTTTPTHALAPVTSNPNSSN